MFELLNRKHIGMSQWYKVGGLLCPFFHDNARKKILNALGTELNKNNCRRHDKPVNHSSKGNRK